MSVAESDASALTTVPEVAGRRRLFAPSRLRGEGTEARRSWQSTYITRIVLLDALCAFVAVGVGDLLRFGPVSPDPDPAYVTWSAYVALPVIWVGAMLVARSYEQRFLWVGAEEFRRVFFASMLMLAAVGTVSWAFQLDLARGFIIVSLLLATASTLAVRYALRCDLHRQRRHGRRLQTALLVGHRNGVAALKAQLARETQHGYQVIGCALPDGHDLPPESVFAGMPVLGGLDEVADLVRRFEVDTVAVLPSPELDGSRLRSLGWELENTEAELLLAPAITEIAGPRVRIRPACGLPLLHVERPELRGIRRLAKETVDRSMAFVAILVALPVLVGLAVVVGTTSRGGVFFRHERIGKDGQPFSMLKFRSMVAHADRMELDLHGKNEGNDVQFKMRRDPRVTRVGAIMRRYSLDELPQLLNVIKGDMSLVGPRPHVTREVEMYGYDMQRRLLVKPGITGLWQISGRSDLSWDDSVRIDVRYVENWSLTLDFMIVCKTIGAVVRGSGAY